MKRISLTLITVFLVQISFIFAQESKITEKSDSTGLPGDHFSLQGALSLFKDSKSLEEFEKKLNTEDNYVNNLDLDENGKTDYIQVNDNFVGSSHAIVLQVAISESETQDIAVIEIEKSGEEKADLQILGNEDIYGEKKIVEPFEETESIDKKGPHTPSFNLIVVNVWLWPCVKFIYAPTYVIWKSPWHWHKYPSYWKPWTPKPWYWHHNHCKSYYSHFRPTPKHRVVIAHQVYLPHRKSSVTVKHRTKPIIDQHHRNKTLHTGKPQRLPVNSNIKGQKATRGSNNKGGVKKQGGGSSHRK